MHFSRDDVATAELGGGRMTSFSVRGRKEDKKCTCHCASASSALCYIGCCSAIDQQSMVSTCCTTREARLKVVPAV